MRISSFVTAMALVSACLAARADSFNFIFGNSSSSFSGSGVLTTGTLVAPGEYLIASVTGTAATVLHGPNLVVSSILAPGTFPTISNGGTFPANDNVLFVTNGVGSSSTSAADTFTYGVTDALGARARPGAADRA